MNKKLLQEYKLNYTLDNIPESLTEDQKIIYGYLHEGFNDSNSSKCREDATNFISGREASEGKHGYDVDDENIEIKPKNYVGKSKLNCGGQFTDFTWARHKKYQNDKVVMSVSGFNHGKLVYVLEFNYNHPTLLKPLLIVDNQKVEAMTFENNELILMTDNENFGSSLFIIKEAF